MANRYELAGKHAVITGGAGGIGRAIARLFLESGASVELWDLSERGLAEARAELGPVTVKRVDITVEAEIEAALEALRQAQDRIDVLINNAGVLGEVKPIGEADPAEFRRVVEVNLIGAFLVTRAVLRRMLDQAPRPHRGHIVNVSSVQAKEGMALAGAYAASKAGLIALTKSVAKETAKSGIHVTCITPTAAETAMAREIKPERRTDILSRIPMGRFVGVDEIARMVAFLSSDDCSFSTGAVFDLSGGRSSY